MSKKKKTQTKGAAPAGGPAGALSSGDGAYSMTGDVRTGMIIGAVVGAIYGIAYATIPKIVKLDVGPVPGVVVGLFFGAGFGACFGGYMGGIGKDMLKPKAIMGFGCGFLLMLIGRLADDTGGAVDKIMDIIVGGSFWGSVGAIAGAVDVFGSDPQESNQPAAAAVASEPESKPEPTSVPTESTTEPAKS